jgi:hypothetical protein
MAPAFVRVPVSESLVMAESAADFYADDPVFAYLLGKKNGPMQRRLVLRNCIVTSDATQSIYSDDSRKAFVHVVEPGSWDGNLHQFILRGTMKIPFVIDSDAIARLSDYRSACVKAMPREGLSHISAVYFSDGCDDLASRVLESVFEGIGACYSVVHTDREASVFESAGFVQHSAFDFHGIGCRVMFRAD